MRICAPLVLLVSPLFAFQPAASSTAPPPLVGILDQELQRNFSLLKEKAAPGAHFLSYAVTEEETEQITASLGALQASDRNLRRVLDCSVRAGSPALDSHRSFKGQRPVFTASRPLPLEDRPSAVQRILWMETDRAWRAASQRLSQLRSATQVKVETPETAADFSPAPPVVSFTAPPRLPALNDEWAPRIRRLSANFETYPGVIGSSVVLNARRELKTLVTSDGTKLQHGRLFVRLTISARAKAADGQDLFAAEEFDADDPARLPKDDTLVKAVARVASQVQRLSMAPETEPFAGPALLSGRAAGVFFHEILGHRLESQRILDETEGRTFAKSLKSKILPDFLSITFDPTRRSFAGYDLNGWYQFDDEGVAARPVTAVNKGVLESFLLSRIPAPGMSGSNGHGRRQPGFEPIARQSNLIVESTNQVDDKALRRMLLNEIVRQGKPYGLYFDEVTGGYTTTSRFGLQAFTVLPLVVYRVYADGRPDELVRGVDIVGTPLASLAKIAATGNTPDVFNGFCGAESGSVPVSAISPMVLVSELEIQRKAGGGDRPPILGRPSVSAGGAQ